MQAFTIKGVVLAAAVAVSALANQAVAQAEKVLKKHKIDLPSDMVVAVSSGSTLAVETDPRPAVVQIGRQLSAALGKLS